MFDALVEGFGASLGRLAQLPYDRSPVTHIVWGGGDGGFWEFTQRIVASMCVHNCWYVCAVSQAMVGGGNVAATAEISRRKRDTSLRFHRAHPASGTWGCAHGVVCISMGPLSCAPVTDEKSRTWAPDA